MCGIYKGRLDLRGARESEWASTLSSPGNRKAAMRNSIMPGFIVTARRDKTLPAPGMSIRITLIVLRFSWPILILYILTNRFGIEPTLPTVISAISFAQKMIGPIGLFLTYGRYENVLITMQLLSSRHNRTRMPCRA